MTIFFIVRDQLIMSFNGPFALNQIAIHGAMGIYEIKDPRQCFEKVVKLGEWWLERIKQDAN